jgi:hypothetical protein
MYACMCVCMYVIILFFAFSINRVYVTESLERACIACFNHEKRERLVLYEL